MPDHCVEIAVTYIRRRKGRCQRRRVLLNDPALSFKSPLTNPIVDPSILGTTIRPVRSNFSRQKDARRAMGKKFSN